MLTGIAVSGHLDGNITGSNWGKSERRFGYQPRLTRPVPRSRSDVGTITITNEWD